MGPVALCPVSSRQPATLSCCHCLQSLPLAPTVRSEFHPTFVLSQPCQVYCIQAGLFACSGFPEIPFWKQHFNMLLTVFYLPGLQRGHPVATLHYEKQKKKKSFILNALWITIKFWAWKKILASSIKSIRKYLCCEKSSTINLKIKQQVTSNTFFFRTNTLCCYFSEIFIHTINTAKVKPN